MSLSTSPASLVSGIVTFLGSPLLVTVVVLAISVLTWIAFSVLTVLSAYSIVYLWSAFERGPANPVIGSEFNEVLLIDALLIAVTTFVNAIAALFDMATSAAASIAQFVVNNFVTILVFILAFAVVIIWDTYHNVIIQALAPVYTCFITPIVRTLLLTLTNLVSLAASAVLPIRNSIREVINEITLDAIIRALICGFAALVESLRLLSLAFSQTLFALIEWMRTAGVNNTQILDVGPNFTSAGATLGLAIANLGTVVTCACQRIGNFDVGGLIIEPVFKPINSTAFAEAYNETLGIVPVFLTQAIARPIVRTLQNFANNTAGLGIFSLFDRPSFNSTFDTASAALNRTGAVLTLFEYALVNITVGIVENVLSACPAVDNFVVAHECSRVGGITNGVCNGTASGQCLVRNFVNNPPSPDAGNGCCFIFKTNSQICSDNLSTTQCTALSAANLAGAKTFTKGSTCPAAQPLFCALQANTCTSTDCGANSGLFTPCACSDCLCSYHQLLDDGAGKITVSKATNVLPCTSGTNQATCAISIPAVDSIAPPEFGFFAAALTIGVDSMYLQPIRYLFNFIFNIDVVFTSTDGFLVWRYTNGLEVFNNGIEALVNEINWLGAVVNATGVLIGNQVQGQLGDHPVVREHLLKKRSPLGEVALERVIRSQSAASTATEVSFALIAEVLFVIGDLLRDTVFFLERFVFTEQFDALIGTIYFTVKSAIASPNHIPNPFAFGQFRFGDTAHGLKYTCGFNNPNDPLGFTPVFTEFINTATPGPACDESVELLNFCRFAFDRVQGQLATADATTNIALQFQPAFINTVLIRPIDATIAGCFKNLPGCAPVIILNDGQNAGEAALAINDYNVTLQAAVQLFVDLDLLISVFVPQVPELQHTVSGFVEPLVPLILPLVDLLVHLPNLFTSAYIACIDIESALNAVTAFVSNFTNLLRALNTAITAAGSTPGTPCAAGASARDSRILCILAQSIDSFVDIFVQSGLQIWRFFQLLVEIIAGSQQVTAVANSITLDPVFADIGNLVFDTLAIVTQIIPRTVGCAGGGSFQPGFGCCFSPDASLGCCFVSTTRLDQCFEGLTDTQCNLVRNNSTVTAGGVDHEGFVSGSTCALADASCDKGCCFEHFANGTGVVCSENTSKKRCDRQATSDGRLFELTSGKSCFAAQPVNCAASNPNFVFPVAVSPGAVCTNDVNLATCSDVNSPFFSVLATFAEGQTCGAAHPGACSDLSSPLQETIAAQLTIVITDVLVLPPKIILLVINAIINSLTSQSPLDVFGAVLDAVLRPTLQIFVDIFKSLAVVLDCLGAGKIAEAFRQTATVLTTIINVGLATVEDLVEFLVFFVAGLVELFTVGTIELLKKSFQILGDLILRLFIGLLGQNFVCGSADAVCAITFTAVHFPQSLHDSCDAAGYSFFACTSFTRKRDVSFLEIEPPPVSATTVAFDNWVVGSFVSGIGFMDAAPDDWRAYARQADAHTFTTAAAGGGGGGTATPNLRVTVQEQYRVDGRFHGNNIDIGGVGTWLPSDEFCGAYLATYGFERAMSEYNGATSRNLENLSVGARCYAYSVTPKASLKEQVRTAMTEVFNEYYTPLAENWQRMRAHGAAYWKTIGADAVQHAKYMKTYGSTPMPSHKLLQEQVEVYAATQILYGGVSVHRARRTAHCKYSPEMIHQALVQSVAVVLTVRDHLASDWVKVTTHATNIKQRIMSGAHYMENPRHKTHEQVAREMLSVPLSKSETRALGFRIVGGLIADKVEEFSIKAAQRLQGFGGMYGTYDEAAQRYTRTVEASESKRITAQRHAVQQARKAGVLQLYRLRFQDRTGVSLARIESGRFSALAVVNGSNIISNDTASALGLFTCDPATQVLCSGCSILDSGVDTTVLAGQTIITFFEDNTTGFLHLFDVFSANQQSTIIDPLGSDVYTTQNKTTPSNLDDFFNIDWPWLWNYTQFTQILTNSTSAATPHSLQTFANQTQSLQIQRAAALNRTDIDNQVYATFAPVINPLVNIGEQAVGAIEGSQSIDTLINFFNVYIACDYQGALVCKSPLGIGLFNALAVTIVLSYLLLSVLTIAVPGAQVPVFEFLRRFFWFIVLWMAYGSSPLCTIQSFFSGIRGLPACLPVDANTILMRTFPQCAYVPPSLIDPRDLAEAGRTLCAQCGTAPRLLDCATAVGFLNGFDVIFYLLEVEFGPIPNAFFAQLFQPILPGVASVAALYTPEHVAALGQAGRDCAMILAPDIVTAATELAFQLATVFLLVGFILGFALLVAWAAGAAIFSTNGIFLQMERGFVYGTVVRKMALRQPGRTSTRKIE